MNDAPTLLRQHGLQVTPQRLAVLAAVQDSPHATADIVVHDVRRTIGSISRQSVYDSLAVSPRLDFSAGYNPPALPPDTKHVPVTTITTWSAAPAATLPMSIAPSATPPA